MNGTSIPISSDSGVRIAMLLSNRTFGRE
jgi:hypothetical protein